MVLGIDPGKSGAAVWITPNRRFDHCRFGQFSMRQIFDFIQSSKGNTVYMENVHAREQDATIERIGRFGVFMRFCGTIDMACAVAGLTVIPVEPQTWQKEFGLGGMADYESRKKAAHKIAKELFQDQVGFRVTKDLADAMLIAEYGYRLENGGLKRGRSGETKEGTGIDWNRYNKENENVPCLRCEGQGSHNVWCSV
jgi:hypothetical protein